MNNPPTFSSPIGVSALINNNDVETQPIKRKRLTQACDACRKKKVKCSGEKPSCNNCTRLGTQCTYLPSTRKRGPRVGLVESLEKRLQQMEKLLQPLKEQGIVETTIDEDNKSTYSIKKQRLSKDSDVPNVTYSRYNVDNSDNNNNNNYTTPANTTTTKSSFMPQNENSNKFHQVIGNYGNNFNQQNQSSSYQQNEYNNYYSRKGSQNEQKDHINFQKGDNNNNDDDKRSGNSTNEKNEDELIYFGKTSIRTGYFHQSELCSAHMPDPPIPETSSQSGSEEIAQILNTPIPRVVASDYLPIDVIEHLASCFFRYIDIQMSMFHEVTFKRQLRQNKVSAFLVFAMCAVSSRYATHPSVARKPPYTAGANFAEIATKMILSSFDYPSVEYVQAFILLAIHMFGTCKGPRAWMYIGMAVRMAQEIGLHKIDEVPLGKLPTKVKSEAEFIHKETRRRTFWSCFLLDRYTACAVGRPTLIDEDDCDVRLPCNEAIWNYDHPYSKSLIEGYFNEIPIKKDSRISLTNNGLCACFISATALLGRVTQFVNRSKPTNSLPPWDPQSQFSILSNEVDMWYKSLSPHYTHTKERLQKLMANGTGIMFVLLHLIYNATVIVLNRPNIAILQNNEVTEPLHVEFLRSSAERCSISSKEIVSIVSDLLQHGCQYFSPLTIYPIFVSTTILINDCYSPDITVADEAERNLATVEEYFTTMGPYWAMGNKFLCMVNEMRKTRAEQNAKGNNNNNFNYDMLNEMSMMGTDAGLLAYWNRAPVDTATTNTNYDDISIILPEEFPSPRWFTNTNEPFITNNDSWTNFLRSPGPFTPRTLSSLSRLSIVKKDKNNNENSNENDYFSQSPTAFPSFPPPIYDGYPSIVDVSLLNPNNSENNFDIWTAGKNSLLHRPIKHWSDINGNNLTSMNEESPISESSATTSSTST